MRIVLAALFILLAAYIIKVDLDEGAITYTKYAGTKDCIEAFNIDKVRVKIQEGDSVHRLFATTSSPKPMTFIDRLTYFYEMNPHLLKQTLQIGEYVYIPILKETKPSCPNISSVSSLFHRSDTDKISEVSVYILRSPFTNRFREATGI